MKSLIPFIKLFKKQLWWVILGVSLTYVTIMSSIGLLSLAGWFISATAFASLSYSLASTFNFFLPSAGVRFFSMVRIGGRYAERLATHEATFKILTNIRVWFYKKIEPLAPAHLIKYKSGDLLTRIVSDIDALDNLYIRILLPCVAFIFIAISVLFYFSFFSVEIAILSVSILVFAATVIPAFSAIISKNTAQQLTKKTADLKTETVEYVQGLAVLKLFQFDKQKCQQLNTHSNDLIEQQKSMSHFSGVNAMLMTLFLGGAIVVVVWVACELVLTKELSGSNIALLALGVIGMYESVLMLPTAFQYLGKTIASARRLLDVISEEPTVVYGDGIAVKEAVNITYENVFFRYDSDKNRKRYILNDISFELKPKDKVAIIGTTGSGKTTLINLLARFWNVTSGRIKLSGIDLIEFSEKALREMFVIVPQNDHVFNTTIRENLLLGNPDATDAMMYSILKVVCLEKYINRLQDGLDSFTGEHGSKLSGGQRKRLVLARALLKDALVYVLDEPTEGLDKKTEIELMDSILTYLKDKTVIIVTHSLHATSKMEKCISISDGMLVDI